MLSKVNSHSLELQKLEFGNNNDLASRTAKNVVLVMHPSDYNGLSPNSSARNYSMIY